ncbi:hypothetical protein U0070_018708 [Myodes glareolus]|uniref:Uncharacterized protein n=1 Tax=Myodes glareolus TaxID=447135 RepID=A0AAW0IVT6_MYOGA
MLDTVRSLTKWLMKETRCRATTEDAQSASSKEPTAMEGDFSLTFLLSRHRLLLSLNGPFPLARWWLGMERMDGCKVQHSLGMPEAGGRAGPEVKRAEELSVPLISCSALVVPEFSLSNTVELALKV